MPHAGGIDNFLPYQLEASLLFFLAPTQWFTSYPDKLHKVQPYSETEYASPRIQEGAEISMEADPGTFTADTLRAYMDLNVNRFSIGIQAFQQVVFTMYSPEKIQGCLACSGVANSEANAEMDNTRLGDR